MYAHRGVKQLDSICQSLSVQNAPSMTLLETVRWTTVLHQHQQRTKSKVHSNTMNPTPVNAEQVTPSTVIDLSSRLVDASVRTKQPYIVAESHTVLYSNTVRERYSLVIISLNPQSICPV